MKANVLYNIGDLRYTEYPLPILKPGEVLVKVHACGICGSDVNRVFKTGTYHFPTIIGHEFAGEVVDIREDEIDLLPKIGTRVGVFPLIPCMKCKSCKAGNYEMCSQYDYLGSRSDGGFAEYIAVPRWNLLPLPDNVTFEQAAMLEPSSVALHALKQFNSIEGKTLSIIGPGTIGNLILLLSKILGVGKTIVIGRNSEKLKISEELGADIILNMKDADVLEHVKSFTDGSDVELCVEGTGTSSCIALALDVTQAGGEIVLMGNPQEDIKLEKSTYWQILRKQLNLHGTWNSSFGNSTDNWKEILSLLQSKKFCPEKLITHRFPLKGFKEGLDIMKDPNVVSNKVMIKIYE